MARTTIVSILVVAVAMQVAMAISPEQFANALEPEVLVEMASKAVRHAAMVDVTTEARQPLPEVLTEKDLAPIIRAEADNHEAVLERVQEQGDFDTFREKLAQGHGLTVEEFDTTHAFHRQALISAAEKLNIPVAETKESYADVLAKVEEAITTRAHALQNHESVLLETEEHESLEAEQSLLASIDLEELRLGSVLFESRATLLDAPADDALSKDASLELDAALAALASHVSTSLCQICEALRDQLPAKVNVTGARVIFRNYTISDAAGAAACKTILDSGNPALAKLQTGICSYPLRLGYQFAEWYRFGIRNVTRMMSNTTLPENGSVNACFCHSFAPSIRIPRMRVWDSEVVESLVHSKATPCARSRPAYCPVPTFN